MSTSTWSSPFVFVVAVFERGDNCARWSFYEQTDGHDRPSLYAAGEALVPLDADEARARKCVAEEASTFAGRPVAPAAVALVGFERRT